MGAPAHSVLIYLRFYVHTDVYVNHRLGADRSPKNTLWHWLCMLQCTSNAQCRCIFFFFFCTGSFTAQQKQQIRLVIWLCRLPKLFKFGLNLTVSTADWLPRCVCVSYTQAASRYLLLSSSSAVKMLIKMTSPLCACWRCGEFMMERVRKNKGLKEEKCGREWRERERDKGANEFEKTRDREGVGGGERVMKLQTGTVWPAKPVLHDLSLCFLSISTCMSNFQELCLSLGLRPSHIEL